MPKVAKGKVQYFDTLGFNREWFISSSILNRVSINYTARNATDVLQVVDFTGLLQVVIKLHQVC